MKKFTVLCLALLMLFSLGVCGYASSGETATTVEDDGLDAVITYADDGENAEREMTEDFSLSYFDGGEKTDTGISGFLFESDDPTVNFYYSELSEDAGNFYTIGGEGKNITVEESGADITARAAEWMSAVGVDSFDSAIVLGDSASTDSCDPVISAKGYTYLNLDGLLVYAEGTARSAMYSDVVGGTTVAGPGAGGMSNGTQTPVVVIRDSLLETTGGTGEEIEGAISVGNTGSRARGIQPQGKSITYLYDSAIVSRTWGAFSTDSARQSLELVSYNSLGLSTSGYGAYADTSCHLFLYGSTVIGASDGIVASNDGEIYAVASDNAAGATELREIMGKTATVEVNASDYAVEDGLVLESSLGGGNTAVQFHMPDQGGSGAKNTKKATLYMQGGELFTDDSLVVDELDAYTAHYSGACIVTKSAQANVLLEGTEMSSRTGVLVHCMINSDSNVNNIADGDEAPGSDFTFRDMDVTGDIVHDDYQRALRLTLDNTVLTGAIYSNTWEDWNAFCEAELEGEYILNPDGYNTFWGVELTLENGAVWNVTETSTLAALNIVDGTVNGTVTENADGTITVEPLEGAGTAETYPLDITLNGTDILSVAVTGEYKDGQFSFDLGGILSALGLSAGYDEDTGAVSVTLP